MTFWTAFKEMIGPIYGFVIQVLVPTVIVMSAICLLTMMLSKNEKAVTASRAWLKRILLAAGALLFLGLFATAMYGVITTIFDTSGQMPAIKG